MRYFTREVLPLLLLHFLARSPVYATIAYNEPSRCHFRVPTASWMERDFLGVLWNWHAAPPGLVIFRYFGMESSLFSFSIHILSSALIVFSIFHMLRHVFGRSLIVSSIAALLFMWLPSIIAYELVGTYDYPTAALLVALILAFARVLTAQAVTRWIVVYLAILAALPLLQTKFHLLWVIAGAIFLLVAIRVRPDLRLTLGKAGAAILPILPVLAVYAKNVVVFGVFGATSWTGLYLGLMTHDPKYIADFDSFERQIAEGIYGPESALTVNYGHPFHAFGRLIEKPANSPFVANRVDVDVPALRRVYGTIEPDRHFALRQQQICPASSFFPNGYPNFNHAHVIRFSKNLRQDGLERLRRAPVSYVKRVLASGFTYVFRPATGHQKARETRQAIAGWDRLVRKALLQPAAWYGETRETGEKMDETFVEKVRNAFADAMVLGGVLFVAVHIALVIAILRAGNVKRRLFYAFTLFVLVYFGAVVNMVNGKETQRMRLYVTPIVFVMGTGILLNMLSREARPPDH